MAAGDAKKEAEQRDLLPADFEFDPLELVLTAKLGEVLPGPKKQEVTQIVHEVFSSFQGPLPHPSILHGYDEVIPGAAERILVMTEKEQSHRHLWEQRALGSDRWYSMVGLLAGWTTAMALAGGAVVAAAFDQPAVGIALAAASATGMVWKLVQGRSEKPEQQAEPPRQVPKGRESRSRNKRR